MKYSKLIPAIILRRYKRFLADVTLIDSQEVITAHVANTGKMTSCWEPNQKVLLSYHNNPKRKLKYSLELIHNGETWINVNTHLANKLVIEAIEAEKISEIGEYSSLKSEYSVGDSRLDICLEQPDGKCFIEVKSVTLKVGTQAQFPDTTTKRGQKHIQELIKLKEIGHRTILFFLVQREDVTSFSPASDLDPVYTELLKTAINSGVEVLVYQCKINESEIYTSHQLKLEI